MNTTTNNNDVLNDTITENMVEEKVPETINKFSRSFIESLDPKVKKVDSDGDIDLFCYTTCDEFDSDDVKACRGLVFNKDKLVLKAFSYNPDYTASDYEYLQKTHPDVSKHIFFDSCEGSLIRIFYASDKWFVSTHRRLNAFKSKWASRISFGEYFCRSLEYEYSTQDVFKQRILSSPLESTNNKASILDKFISTLDKGTQYMFLLQNNKDNRIVCDAPEYPRVFHVGTFLADTNELDLDVRVDLPYPEQRSFATMDDVFEYVENTIDYQIKIMNQAYNTYFKLRGNESSIKNRYLQIRMDQDKKNDFQELYPNYLKDFDMYENIIYEIAVQVFNAYMNRYIHKKHVTMPPEEYSIMRDCHAWHIANRQENHISFDKVMSVLNSKDSPTLNKMIRRYLNNQRLKSIRTEDNVLNEDSEEVNSRFLQRK
jgi:hypothetical protein